jgi:hypothetical protein
MTIPEFRRHRHFGYTQIHIEEEFSNYNNLNNNDPYKILKNCLIKEIEAIRKKNKLD